MSSPHPDGVLYALRSSYAAPPHPVRIDPDGAVTALPCVDLPALPGTLTEVVTDDRRRRARCGRGWCCRADAGTGAAAAVDSRRTAGQLERWSWRWNPWLLAARGYAVLLPDPALSTGYGQDFIQRGWGAWGGPPFDDLMAATDAACAHPRIDADPDRGDGRVVRRLHGQLDRRPHRPFRRDRHPRQPVGARPVRRRPPTRLLLAPGDDAGDDRRQLAAPVRRANQHADAGDPRRQGLSRARSARRCGCGTSC